MYPQLRSAHLGDDKFEAPPGGGDEHRTFGGLVLAQVLAAAAATVGDRRCHSLHLLFAGAGDARHPIHLNVDRLRDGRHFTARNVRAEQQGRFLASATLSFSNGNSGPQRQIAMPSAPDPESIEDQRVTRQRNAIARGAPVWRNVAEELIDARPVERLHCDNDSAPCRMLWFKSRKELGEDAAAHQQLIVFASDMGLVHLHLAAHNAQGGGALEAASLDHAIWFHRHARADEWLLHVQRAPVAHAGRGLSQGAIFNRQGDHVASVAQEVLIRQKVG
jgi:acyl-CoA thioesterase-2